MNPKEYKSDLQTFSLGFKDQPLFDESKYANEIAKHIGSNHHSFDITTKNPQRFQKYLNNFKLVRTKIVEVEKRDHIRNFKPPISGEEIMNYFNINPGKEIGIIKELIKESILEGEIKNNYESAKLIMIKKGKALGLVKNEK